MSNESNEQEKQTKLKKLAEQVNKYGIKFTLAVIFIYFVAMMIFNACTFTRTLQNTTVTKGDTIVTKSVEDYKATKNY